MPIHIYWGEDEFLINRAIKQMRYGLSRCNASQVLNPHWTSFNCSEYPPEAAESIPQAFVDIMTPPMGDGGRIVYLPNSSLLGVCPKETLVKLEHILPAIPETNVLLITSQNKPDGRNKSVKLLLEHADVNEFPLIAQWQTDALIQQVRSLALEVGVTLTPDACKQLVEAVGNNTRLMFSELNKLRVYVNGLTVNADIVKELVVNNAAYSLQLAAAIRIGNVGKALELVENLINCNEPALRIVRSPRST